MNLVIMSRIIELSEKKPMFHRIKKTAGNWKTIVIVSVLALTLKPMAEQIAMMLIRGN